MSKIVQWQASDVIAARSTAAFEGRSPVAGERSIFEIGQWGMEVAEAIAAEPELNHGLAEMSLRNLAGLVNRMDEADLADLPEADRQHLLALAGESAVFLYGEKASQEVSRNLQIYRPGSVAETELRLLQLTFNEVQSRVSIGPGREHGYGYNDEPAIRGFVISYATAFAAAMFGLNSAGNRLTTEDHALRYVESTINAARPSSMRGLDRYADSPALCSNQTREIV